MNLNNKTIKILELILPFILVVLAEFLKPYTIQLPIILKIIALVLIFVSGFKNIKKLDKRFNIAVLIIIFWLAINVFKSFSINAAIEDGLRYLFPVLFIYYSFSFINDINKLFKYLIAFVLLNDVIQILLFILYLIDSPTYFNLGFNYKNNSVNGIIRANGFTHSFDFLAFTNVIAYVIVDKHYKDKYKQVLKAVFLLFSCIGLVYKYIVLLLMYFVLEKKYKTLVSLSVLIGIALLTSSSLFIKIQNGAVERLNLYIIKNNSMRSESLKLTYNYVKTHNPFIGEGVGSFGGPASVKHKSPLYKNLNFEWLDYHKTSTTDNFYPHLFIENGLFFGIFYLITIFSIFFIKKQKFKEVYFLLIFLILSNFFNFSINIMIYQFFSFLIIVPLVNHKI